jgi:NADPH:quinone reductase-like Zn-dependent oxidoreductase
MVEAIKQMTLHQYGDADNFVVEAAPIPTPAAGDVRVKVHAVSVNPVDYKWRRNGPFTTFPVVLGWDISGVVDAIGAGTSTDFQVGDTVFGMVRFPQEGRAYAEYVTAPATDIAIKPEAFSHAEAAAATLAALTAHQALDAMDLKAGQKILIHAAAGGVGHYAVQLAKARGAHVIGTASAANREFVLALGADEFVDYHERPFEEQVANLDAVFDCVGGDTLPRSFAVIKPGGWLVSIVDTPSANEAERLGVHVAQPLVHPSRTDLEKIAHLADAGRLRSHVSARFPLDRVGDAHRAVETGRTIGKVVLEIG